MPDLLLQDFERWKVEQAELSQIKAGVDEFQITVPLFNFTLNVVRDCFDGTNCTYLTYSDNNLGGVHESFTWDEE
jgi:hypothetical protein